MLHSHQIKIATDFLQTGIWLASDTKIGVDRTMLYQGNPTALYQSEASPIGQSGANLFKNYLVWMKHYIYRDIFLHELCLLCYLYKS